MRRSFNELVAITHAPPRYAQGGYDRNLPMLAYCIEAGRRSWRYDPENNLWVGPVAPDVDLPAEIPSGLVQRPETTVLVIADNTRETFLTLPPSEAGGPVTIYSENCDVLIIEALCPDLFPLVFRNLLDFTEHRKYRHFENAFPEPILKVDDLLFASLKDDEELSGDVDPGRFIGHLRGMPLVGDGDLEVGENLCTLEQFRFVECFLTSKERGLANLRQALEVAIAIPEMKSLVQFLRHPDLTPDREKRLWRECSRIASAWGRNACVNRKLQYSLVPSFFLRASMVFDVRSLGFMDQSRIFLAEIEQKIQRVVISVLKRIHGNGYWTKFQPSGLRREVENGRRSNLDAEQPMNHLYLRDYEAIVECQWEDFQSYFTLNSWPEYKLIFPWLFRESLRTYPPLRWYRALCFLRNRAYHPTRMPLTTHEYRLIVDVKEHFEAVDAKIED